MPILQNDPKLHEDIQRVGCLYLSLVRMVEVEHGTPMDIPFVNEIWEQSKLRGFVSASNMMRNPDGVIRLLGGKLAQVGQQKAGINTFWQWAKGPLQEYRYMVEKVKTPGPVGTHFRLCDKDGVLIYDPYSFRDYAHTQIGEYTLYSRLG